MKITITENSTGTDINVSDDFHWEYQEDSGIVGVALPLNTKDGYEAKDFYHRRYAQKETLAEAVSWLNLNLTMELNRNRPLKNETPFVKDKYALNKPFSIAAKGSWIRILEEPTAEISSFELTSNYEWLVDPVWGDVTLVSYKKRLAAILPALIEEQFTVLIHTDIEPLVAGYGIGCVYPTMTEAIQAVCKAFTTENMNLTVTEENGLSIDVEVSGKFRWLYDKPDFVAAFNGNDLVGTVRPLYKINEPVKRRFSHTTDYRNKKEVFEIKDYKAKEFAFVDDWQEEYPLSRAVRYLNALLTDEVTPAKPDSRWAQAIRHRQQPLALFDWLGKYLPWHLAAFENTISIIDVDVKKQDVPTAEPTVFVLPNFYYVIQDLFNFHLTIVHTETKTVVSTVCKMQDENSDPKSSNPFAYWNAKTNVIVDTFDTMTSAIAGLIKELQC